AILVQGDLEKVLIKKKLAYLDKSKWDRLDKKALSIIQLFLTNNVLQKVLMEKTTFTLWKRLETLYTTKFLANQLELKQRLYTFRMNKGEHLRDHINEFITLFNDLKNVKVQIDDNDQAMLLLCYLPL
ncbi:hypothetical protein Goari_026816, partial [Gossypium aridum]|nr:hypothetical protein [Gossypium aridum]